MSEEIETNKIYEILDNDDVFRLDNGDTFTVQKFKKLVIAEYSRMLIVSVQVEDRKSYLYSFILPIKINEETNIYAGDLTWKSSQEGINCQVIKTSSKGWKKGKLKIEINASVVRQSNPDPRKMEAQVSFCSNEPPESLSPLDEIRQSEEYKKAGQ